MFWFDGLIVLWFCCDVCIVVRLFVLAVVVLVRLLSHSSSSSIVLSRLVG